MNEKNDQQSSVENTVIQEKRKKERFWYLWLPLMVMVPLICFYFSEVPWMVEIVCPDANREYGLLENLQALLLIVIIWVCIKAAIKKEWRLEKIAFGLLAAFGIFVFLEEINYGGHYLEYLTGDRHTFLKEWTGHYNVHNRGNNDKIMKRSVYGIMGIIFIVLPYIKDKLQNPLIEYISPKKAIVYTAVLTIVVEVTNRTLIATGICKDAGLGINIGEFSELMIYYIFLLYLWEIVFEKKSLKHYLEKSGHFLKKQEVSKEV